MTCPRGPYCPMCSVHSTAEYIAHGGTLPPEACIMYAGSRFHPNCRSTTDPFLTEPRPGYIDGGTAYRERVTVFSIHDHDVDRHMLTEWDDDLARFMERLPKHPGVQMWKHSPSFDGPAYTVEVTNPIPTITAVTHNPGYDDYAESMASTLAVFTDREARIFDIRERARMAAGLYRPVSFPGPIA